MRALTTILLAGALALTGCIGATDADEPIDAASADAPLAGEDERVIRAVEPVTMDLTWQGGWDGQVFGCVFIQCAGTGVGTWDGLYELADGMLDADLTITFSAPEAQARSYGFGIATACDAGCDFEDYVVGEGPVLTLSTSDLDPDEEYLLIAWSNGYYMNGIGGQVWTPTDFTVEGTITHLTEAGGMDGAHDDHDA